MSHNVTVVCEVLAARIRKCEAFPGRTKFGWSEAWEPLGDLAEWNPGGPKARNAYNLLGEVKIATKRPPWTAGVLFFIPIFLLFLYKYVLSYIFIKMIS
jgi:hypothetical protein